MYALRERRVHVTQEDFELAVAKVTLLLTYKLATVILIQKDQLFMFLIRF